MNRTIEKMILYLLYKNKKYKMFSVSLLDCMTGVDFVVGWLCTK